MPMTKPVDPTALGRLLLRLFQQLTARRRMQFALLLALMLMSALAEVISLSAVLPFIGVLSAPERVYHFPLVAPLAAYAGFTHAQQLVLPFTIAFAVSALLAGGLRMLLLWFGTRITFACASDLSAEVYRRTLNQPYLVHLSRNSSEVISSTTNKIDGVTFGVIQPLLILCSSAVLLLAITCIMLLVNPYVASVSIAAFGASYGLVTWLSRRRLRRNSEKIAREQTQVIKALQEGLGGIRDVLLDGSQSVYCDIYRKADRPLRRAQGDNVFIAGSPRFVVESVGMVLIAALAYQLSLQAGGLTTALPVLAALALGAQRLLPALQNMYSAWATIVATQATLLDVTNLLEQPEQSQEQVSANKDACVFKHEIRLESVYFRYSEQMPWVLNDVTLSIPQGSHVGFVGHTGGGKSTLLDLLMGLTTPGKGKMLVDGRPLIGKELHAWQKNIAHVPQSIYLADATIAENIAFGIPANAIDMERVRIAAQRAQIAEFIQNSPMGYESMVGERGVRLSGGQRQRIGIARALYKNAPVLILDEATSALDNTTEKSIMQLIEQLDRKLTVLIIAHRLSSVSRCDFIVEMKNGRIHAQGTYEELIHKSESFKKMVNIK